MRYRYHWSFKLLALMLAVISGAVLVVGAAGLVLGQTGYYESNRQSLLYNQANNYCNRAVSAVFDRYAWQDTGIEPKLFERFFRWGADVDLIDELEYAFYYSIYDYDENVGNMLESNYNGSEEFAWSTCRFMDVRRGYVTEMPKADYYPGYNQYIASRDSGMAWLTHENTPLPEPGEGVTGYEYYVVGADSRVNPQNISMKSYNHADAGGADYTIYRIEYNHYDSYYVEVGLTAEQMVALLDEPAQEAEFLPEILQEYEAYFLPMTLWSGLVLALSCFWLALVAGKSPYREGVKPDGLNRIPGVYSPIPMGAFYTVAKLPVDDCEKFCAWCLSDFSYEGETIMMAPATGFYTTPGAGKNEVRIAYVLKKEDLARSLVILRKALEAYPGRVLE